MTIKSKIILYFEEHHPGLALCEVTPKHIQDYYTYELTVRGVSANTVIHRHANIRKALQHAFKLGLIDTNPADRIERPKKEKFVGSVYEEDELNRLFEIVKGDSIELGVILGAFYGLRRSEAVGLKWDAIDFKKKTITIRHTVTQATIDGKSKIKGSDKDKSQLPQLASCTAVRGIIAPSESGAGTKPKAVREILLQEIQRLYLCKRNR